MSQRKSSEDVSNNGQIFTQISTEEKKEPYEQNEIKIVIDKNEEFTKNSEKALKEIDEVESNKSDNSGENSKKSENRLLKKYEDSSKKSERDVFTVMAFNQQRPYGQLLGTQPPSLTPQHTYVGSVPYYQPSPELAPYRIHVQDLANPPSEETPPLPNESNMIQYSPESRNSLIKYIMSVVFIMLLMTAGFIAIVLAVPGVKEEFNKNRLAIIIPSVFLTFSVNYAMTWLTPFTRHPPCNIICLLLSVVGMSLICGVVTSYFGTQIVLYSFITTTAVVFVCLLLACTHFDFTSYYLYLIVIMTAFCVLAVVILMTLVAANTPMKPPFLAFLVCATLLQVLILTIHLQTIIGGRTIELNELDYSLGAYMLYMSIIDIFIKMICMFGISSEM